MPSETTPLTLKGKHDNEYLKRLKAYQGWAFFVTFGSYFMAHFSRKCYPTIKKQLHDDADYSVLILSEMDTVFYTAYAIGNIVSGKLGDTFSPSTVLSIGLFGSGGCLFALTISLWEELMKENERVGDYFILALFALFGLFQSAGPPSATAVMGNWFCDEHSVKNRGVIFGFWTCHKHCGSLTAALCAAYILKQEYAYWWALLIPSLACIYWGFLTSQLIADPMDVDIVPDEVRIRLKNEHEKIQQTREGVVDKESPTTITLLDALKIRMVPQIIVAFGFFQLIHLVFSFWLPYFLGKKFDSATANLIASVYSIGSMPGSITIGYASDLIGGRRATVIGIFMSCLIVLLSIFCQHSEELGATALLILLAFIGILIGGPNSLIVSSVSVDLASHPSIKGSKKPLGTITGLINGCAAMIASLGLSVVGPLHSAYGWDSVWMYLIVSAGVGTLLMTPKMWLELFPSEEEDEEEELV